MTLIDAVRDRLPGPVETRETHTSVVLLAGDRAYKLRKPVCFGFIDLRDPEARRRVCGEEIRVNRTLAADIVIGMRGVTAHGALVSPDDERAVDWLVEMRRFDESRTLAALLHKGVADPSTLEAVGRRLAAFHEQASVVELADPVQAVSRRWRLDLEELVAAVGAREAPRLDWVQPFMSAFLSTRGAELAHRAASGRVRDGHGDLRAEHVVFVGDGVTIFDRIEFDASLRTTDVADDLAFLLMDLEDLDARWAADLVLRAYRDAGGDPGDDELLAALASHRALVRAKVELLRAEQLHGSSAHRRAESRAFELCHLAERLAWRARRRVLILVTGPPASGKSHLARSLAARGGLPLLSSDLVRREVLAPPPQPSALYTNGARRHVYAELARRAEAALAHSSVVVDATFGDPEIRTAFMDAVGSVEAVRVVECRAPLSVIERRARLRAGRPGEASDATPEIALRLARTHTPLAGVAAERRLVLDTQRHVDALVQDVAAWVDG